MKDNVLFRKHTWTCFRVKGHHVGNLLSKRGEGGRQGENECGETLTFGVNLSEGCVEILSLFLQFFSKSEITSK